MKIWLSKLVNFENSELAPPEKGIPYRSFFIFHFFMQFYSPSWEWSTNQVSTHLDQDCDFYRHLYFWKFLAFLSKSLSYDRPVKKNLNSISIFFCKINFEKTQKILALYHNRLSNRGRNPIGGGANWRILVVLSPQNSHHKIPLFNFTQI